MTKTLHRGNYQVTISPKGRSVNSKRTFEVFIHEFHNQRSIASKKCVCIGALAELERWFDKEKNIENTLSEGAEKFCFELVPY